MRTQWTTKGNRDAGFSCSCDRGLHRYLRNFGGGGEFEPPKPLPRYVTDLSSNTGRGKRLLSFTKCPGGSDALPASYGARGKVAGVEVEHCSCGKPPWASPLPFVYSICYKLRMCQCYKTFYIRSFRLHVTCLSHFLSACSILRWTAGASVQRPTSFGQFKVIIKDYIQVDNSK